MEQIPVEKIIRSRRRTIALEITSGATLVVRAPLRTSAADIEKVIRQKSSWIQKKLVRYSSDRAHPVMNIPKVSCFLSRAFMPAADGGEREYGD